MAGPRRRVAGHARRSTPADGPPWREAPPQTDEPAPPQPVDRNAVDAGRAADPETVATVETGPVVPARVSGTGARRASAALVVVLALAVAALGTLLGLRVAHGGPRSRAWNLTAQGAYTTGTVIGADRQAALDAAVKAAPLLLSYDYRTLPANLAAAKAVLAPSYAQTFAATFASSVEQTATTNKAVVQSLVRAAGVSGTSDGTVTCLLFVDQTLVSSASSSTAQVNQDRVVVSLQRVGGRWLVTGVVPT